MRLYLDNCSYNRPFDSQEQLTVRMETDAKLQVQESVRNGEYDLVWSFVLDYENAAHPQANVSMKIAEWKGLAVEDIGYSVRLEQRAAEYMKVGLRQKDASHVACAVEAGCDFFLTTDKGILNKNIEGIELINPIDFVRRQENAI
jgi:predicted nucleic acid-binding protein